MIKLAVIGAGYWGTKLIEEYIALSKNRSDMQLTAIADASPEKLQTISHDFKLPSSMLKKDYRKILEDSEITGVHIATPNETHYEVATEALFAGKHVLLEKPMSLNSRDAFRLARQAEKSKMILLVGHIFRFNNAINKVKEMIEKNDLGEIRCVDMRWTSFLPPPKGRDVISDLAPHPIDILNHLLEEWPNKVYVSAKSYARKEFGLEEVALATMELPREIIASIGLSWIHHGPKQRTVTIVGDKSTVRIKAVEQRIELYSRNVAKNIEVERNNTIESEIDHFVECIKNSNPPINSALTGALNVSVIELMRKSLRKSEVTLANGG